MPKCFHCNFDTSSIESLYMHFKFKHKLDKFIHKWCCVDCDCVVTFSQWKHLRKHFVQWHHFSLKTAIKKVSVPEPNDIVIDNETAPTVSGNPQADEEVDLLPPATPSDECLQTLLVTCGTKLVAKLYAQPGRPRSQVQEFVNHTSDFLNSSLTVLNEIIGSKLERANVNRSVIEDISESVSVFKNPFQGLHSDYLRLKFLKEHGYFIEPQDYVIGSDMFSKFSKQKATWALQHVKGKFIPLRVAFKAFLELPNVLTTVLNYLNTPSPPGIITDFVHSAVWHKKRAQFVGKIVIPLFLYYDDYEPDKDIGHHSAKLGAIYTKIASLPSEFQASLENIFLVALFSAQDRVDFCNKAVFRKVIEELNYLQETGIEVTNNNTPIRLYFTIGLVVCDNLAMHTLLGFAEGFQANFPCRFCRIYRNNMYSQCQEDPTLLRDKVQHVLDCDENDVSATGVNDRSVLQDIRNFDPTENPSTDLLHDLWEGVAVYDVNHILHYLIFEKEYFSVIQLNTRIATFNYGDSISNKPIQVTEYSVKKKTLKMTGNEMRTLIRTLTHLVGDLVPENDPVWEFYLILRHIIDILLCRNVQEEILCTLSVLIMQHHQLYLELFKDTLKPKFHLLLHYPRIMRLSGCPLNFACDRFEAFHQPSVQDARATTSRKFIAHTLAVKVQLRLAYRLICERGLDYQLEVGPERFCQLNPDILPAPFRNGEFLEHSFVTINGTRYQKNTCVVMGCDDDTMPLFGLICCILVSNDSEVMFLCNVLVNKSFSYHFHSYNVVPSTVTKFVAPSALLDYHPVLFCTGADGKKYVTLHHAL